MLRPIAWPCSTLYHYKGIQLASRLQLGLQMRPFSSPSPATPNTPMMRQYNKAKREHPGFMVLFRSGDFFEIFNEDAVDASGCLGITLTKRQLSKTQQAIPMCGIPHHALDTYLPRLINYGYRVAICDQLETRAEADAKSQSLIRRGVVRLVTPGTITEDTLLSPNQNNFLATIAHAGLHARNRVNNAGSDTSQDIGLSWYDLSTGELGCMETKSDRVFSELTRIAPVELVIPRSILMHPPDGIELLLGDRNWQSREMDINSTYQLESTLLEDCLTVVRGDSTFTRHGIDPFMEDLGDLHHSFIHPRSRVAQKSLYGLLNYVLYTQLGHVPALSPVAGTSLSAYSQGRETGEEPAAPMMIDSCAFSSLEITRTYGGQRKGSLLSTIDKTVTAGGGRTLRSSLGSPLTDVQAIRERLEAVRFFVQNPAELNLVRGLLVNAGDTKRCLQRVELGRASPRDIWAIGKTIGVADAIVDSLETALGSGVCHDAAWEGLSSPTGHHEAWEGLSSPTGHHEALEVLDASVKDRATSGTRAAKASGVVTLRTGESLVDTLQFLRGAPNGDLNRKNELIKLAEEIRVALGTADDGQMSQSSTRSLSQGGYIAAGYCEELDRLRQLSSHKDELVEDLVERYRAITGVQNVKVKRNAMMGSFLEVPHRSAGSFSELPEFTQVKVLKNVVRFKTTELYKLEGEIQQADFKISQLELSLFRQLCRKITDMSDVLRAVGAGLERIDVTASLAKLAVEARLVEPEIVEGAALPLQVEGGRHLVVESMQRVEVSGMLETDDTGSLIHAPSFVSNDLSLSASETNQVGAGPSCMLLTGPNMAGKSTFLRQNAHIVLLSHIGSFVPATSARIGIVDRLFTRIGSSDELIADRSTFMVEMEETANILANATNRSLVIIDEIGRGTSTQDGMAIAWSVLEELLNIRARTLFATHFHKLAELALEQENDKTWTDSKSKPIQCQKGDLECWHMGIASVGERHQLTALDDQSYQVPIVFTYKVERGVADRSYGVHCAALAGVPYSVVQRATELLESHQLRGM